MLAYSFQRTNGAKMAAITANVTAINKMVRKRTEAVPLNTIAGQPTLNSIQHLVKQLVTSASHIATAKWGGKHGLLPLVLIEYKTQLAAGDNNLDCKWIAKTELLNPIIEDDTKGRELLQLQE